ncbi:BTAD domain-containing putative transcriptional regulator [Mycolicibacterium sp. P9-64]|uniref:BTAD domain-containing putative transcriptional regulator n=1 Tax=Mycolicibacterium sp. P9-64 TaxID=2024612 RepID=UPI0024133D14|nr:BTAD domain-containing putative transcriptional regulator [Mycolicibacterium sp. P9-64]
MPASEVGFGVLGPLEMTVDGARVSLGSRKQRAVLAMLVINRNRVVGSESLIDAVWEQRVGQAARGSLHTYVSNLRRVLNDAGLDGRTVLAAAPSGYRLSVDDIDCDIGRFVIEKGAGIRAAAAGQFEIASRHLSAALGEWRGRVLDDLGDSEFVTSFAAALVEDQVTVHIAYAEAEIACGRANAVIGALERLTVEHPHREPLWAQLITAYYVAERQSDALDAYRRLKAVLAEDLGIEPVPNLRALHERVLRQEVVDVRRAALTAASLAANTLDRMTTTGRSTVARLRAPSGEVHALFGAATRVGRLPGNDIVLDDAEVSRHHAVLSDTGTTFVITDLRSANGVYVQDCRIRGSVPLSDGDRIRICRHEFVFELEPGDLGERSDGKHV